MILLFALAAPVHAQIVMTPSSLPPGTVGTAYNQAVLANDSDPDDITGPFDNDDVFTYTVTAGAIPPGLTLNFFNGVISGTPSAGGTYPFTVTATDLNGATGTQSYSITVGSNLLSLAPTSLPSGTQGVPYNQTVTASGGTGPYTYSVAGGALPAGLSLNPTSGAITGIPTGSGPSSFTIQALDTLGNIGTQAYTVNVGTSSLTVNPASLPNGMQGVGYSQTVSASGGTGPYTFSISSGTLPAGLTLNASSGVISGTPTTLGQSIFTVQALDSGGNAGSRSYAVSIGGAVLTVSPGSLPNGTQGTVYSQTVSASGGTGPYAFAVTSGTLPAGLTLSSGGVISGTPAGSGTSSFTVGATDTLGNTGSQAYSITIGTNSLTVNPASLPSGTLGVPYSQTVTVSGGTGPYTFSISPGALPAGLTLNPSTGVISGTPTALGSAVFTVQVADSAGNAGNRTYSVNIGTGAALTLTPTSLPNGTQGTAYSQTVTASGGTGPYTFALTAGALPAGLTLSSSGVISGTPTASGTASFTVGATDSLGNTGSQAYSLTIGTVSLTVNPPTLPPATQGLAYSQTVSATGGTGPYTFSISAGALPAGLTLNATTGVVSGTPTASGVATFTVQAVDSLGNVGTRAYTLNTGAASLTVTPATLPATVVGHAYSQTVSATGGTGPYTFSIVAGALPPGLTLNPSTGVISGTPTSAGAASFTVQVVDALGNVGTRSYTFAGRTDPALDADVQGLIAAEVATAQRFASAQIDNISHHLEGLHDQFTPCTVNFGIAPPPEQASPQYGYPAAGNPYGYAGVGAGPGGRRPPQPARVPIERKDCSLDWAFWTAGSVQFGSVSATGVASGNRFTTAGLTAGVDFRTSDRLIVGAAVGYGANRSDIGQDGTRSDASSYNAALYGSLRLMDPVFLDAALGFGTLGYDNRRWVTSDNVAVEGTRNGSYWFGTLEASYELTRDQFKLAPYARADFMAASLNGYGESGPSAQLLNYDAMHFNAVSGALGLRGSIDIPMSFGTLSPTARFEYKQTSQSAFDQSMYFIDLGPGTSSIFSQPAATLGMATGTLGLRVRGLTGLSAELEYGLTGGSNSLQAQMLRTSLRVPF